MWGWLRELAGPALEALNGWRERRHELKLEQHKLKLEEVRGKVRIAEARVQAKIAMDAQRASADINWELESIRNSGWKDEYLTIWVTAFMTFLAMPWTREDTLLFVETLAALPLWVQVICTMPFAAAFGIRVFTNFKALIKA